MEDVGGLPGCHSHYKGAQLKELLDAGHVPIPSKWVDAIKNFHERLKPDYTPEFKSRLVSCGNFEDSTEVRTDAPTSDLETHALVAAFAASHNRQIYATPIFKLSPSIGWCSSCANPVKVCGASTPRRCF